MSDMNSFLFLSDQTLASLEIGTRDVVDSIEAAVQASARGAVWTAPKSVLLPEDGRYIMSTLSAADDPPLVAVKSVMFSPRNKERGLSGINGSILLLDSETGLLRAVMDANWVTAVRTAGLSGVAARRLANPNSSSIAFVGCGVQARSHLDAFSDMFPLTEVRAFGRGRASVDRFCDVVRQKGLSVKAFASAQEALDGADIVVTSISISFDVEPFLDARWLKPGTFAAITDLAIPWMPDGMPAFETVIIDDREQEAANEKPMVDPQLISGDLAALVSDGLSLGFEEEKRSAFVFRGLAIGDFAVAALAYERARNLGKGVAVDG